MAMNRVVVLGGYGAVGREVVSGLHGYVPEIVVAGRDLVKARAVDGAIPMRIDLRSDDIERLDADAVVMCAESENVRVAEMCLRRGVHYVDVSASYEVLAGIEKLGATKATGVLSVGLAPGVTNLLAREFGGAGVEIGVLIGSGERHGPGAVEWTLDSLGDLGESWRMRFPPPYGIRTVRRFPVLRPVHAPRRRKDGPLPGFACLVRPPPRLKRFRDVAPLLRAVFRHVHLGGDGFAVAVASGGRVRSFAGRRQSRATGLAAALVVRRLDGMPPGVRHIEDVVGPDFLPELAAHGFELGEYDSG